MIATSASLTEREYTEDQNMDVDPLVEGTDLNMVTQEIKLETEEVAIEEVCQISTNMAHTTPKTTVKIEPESLVMEALINSAYGTEAHSTPTPAPATVSTPVRKRKKKAKVANVKLADELVKRQNKRAKNPNRHEENTAQLPNCIELSRDLNQELSDTNLNHTVAEFFGDSHRNVVETSNIEAASSSGTLSNIVSKFAVAKLRAIELLCNEVEKTGDIDVDISDGQESVESQDSMRNEHNTLTGDDTEETSAKCSMSKIVSGQSVKRPGSPTAAASGSGDKKRFRKQVKIPERARIETLKSANNLKSASMTKDRSIGDIKAALHPKANLGRELTEDEIHKSWNTQQLGFKRGKKLFAAKTTSAVLIEALFALLDHSTHDVLHADKYKKLIGSPNYVFIVSGVTDELSGGAIMRLKSECHEVITDRIAVLEALGVGLGKFLGAEHDRSMHPKPECSKCGLSHFASLDSLETHIAEQHFGDVDAYYECLYPNCGIRFHTAVACLKHELDVHLNGDHLHSTTLIKRRDFVRQRLAIHECLNQSINVTGIFVGQAESNTNNFESLTTNDSEGKKSTNLHDKASSNPTNNLDSVNPDPINDSLEAVIESVARRTNSISSVSQLPKPRLSNSEQNMRIKRANSQRSCAEKVGPRLVNVSVTADPSDTLTLGTLNPALERRLSKAFERRSQRLQNLTKPRTYLKPAINLDRLCQPEGLMCSTAASSSMSKSRMEISEPNNKNDMRIGPENSSRPCVVKVGQKLMVVQPLDPAMAGCQLNWSSISNPRKPRKLVYQEAEKVGARLVNVSVTAGPDLSNNESIGKNNETIEPVTSSRPFEIKDEPKPSTHKPEHKRTEYETSVVKDEPCVIEELTTTFPAPTDHDYLSFSNNESAAALPQPKRSRIEISPETSSGPSVIKDEPSLMDELAETIFVTSGHSDTLTLANFVPIDKNNETIEPETSSSLPLIKDESSLMDELASAILDASNDNVSLIPSNSEPTAPLPKPKKSRKQNFSALNDEDAKRIEPQNSSRSSVVKEESCLVHELDPDIPGPSNYRHSNKQRASSEGASTLRYSENLSSERTEHENSVVKDEPSLIDELAAMIPAPSNIDEYLIRSNKESAPPSQKPKRSRKQDFAELDPADINNTHLRITCLTPDHVDVCQRQITEDDPSLTNRVLNLISSNVKKSRKQNLDDVDDEDDRDFLFSKDLQILSIQHPGKKCDDSLDNLESAAREKLREQKLHEQKMREIELKSKYEKIKNDILPEQKNGRTVTTPAIKRAVIKAKSEGLLTKQIATIFDISVATVRNIMIRWQTAGTVENKPRRKGSGRKRQYDEAIEQFVLNIIKEDPYKAPTEIVSEIQKNRPQSQSTVTMYIERITEEKEEIAEEKA
ncbi:hypothetical protein Ddc_15931 [Ditylenchus destructor]|nr:hypothetical protein Ddc_15931 [Ditylenchus destructor]